jgi:MFS superfamily sulfate permease-like transporter
VCGGQKEKQEWGGEAIGLLRHERGPAREIEGHYGWNNSLKFLETFCVCVCSIVIAMEKGDNKNRNNSRPSGSNAGSASSGGASDLMGLFAPPPPLHRHALHPSLFVSRPPPSETDPLVPSSTIVVVAAKIDDDGEAAGKWKHHSTESRETINPNGIGIAEWEGGDDDNGTDDLTRTVRRINHQNTSTTTTRHKIDGYYERNRAISSHDKDQFSTSIGSGRELFLKTAAASAQQPKQPKQHQQGQNYSKAKSPENNSPLVAPPPSRSPVMVRSLLAPFASPSTWMGGILFVLYHVVFCMANGGSITRPYSGGSTSSLLGDMARYTALGIIVSCPFLVYSLSDKAKSHQTGIAAMYPSADLFLAPFLAEAAAIIDKTIPQDWTAGGLRTDNDNENDDELFLTELWFGSFALVVSFGMFAAGSLLILASRIKLANLGTYLPYGVLCGFFSSVGILMWKLAITIDTPNNTSRRSDEDGEQEEEEEGFRHHHWTIVLLHHLPSLVVGIAMNRLGPKHPFFVTGLIILTVVVFYLVMLVLGISLEEAQTNGWFYSHEELHSSIPIGEGGTIGSAANDGSSWRNNVLPPHPFGTWFAVFGRSVHWRAVFKGAEHMVALAILYLLRASIHAAALKKNIHNLIRRVPIEGTTTKTSDEEGTTATNGINKIGGFGRDFPSPLLPRHRRNPSSSSVSLSIASQLAQTVREEVRIVNLSLADPQNLEGKYYNSPSRPSKPSRATSVGSTATAVIRNNANNNNNNNDNNQQKNGKISILAFPTSSGSTPPIPPRSPLKPSNADENNNVNNDDSLLLPTAQQEVSGLTQRTVASYTHAETLSPQRKRPFEGASIGGKDGNGSGKKYGIDYVEIHAPATDLTLEEIFVQYGYGLFVTGACGGFGCCPTIATSSTMYAIGAGKPSPQYFSVVLLLVAFYSSGFELVRFIPKAAFSSLLVLSAADNIVTWFIKPISKMDNLLEWSVVPFIVMFSLLVGFLNAVILGIGVSTFLFVTDFFRVGVVKYDASGLEIRSRIERSLVQSVWLDTHGDNLRVLVLQNYLFFGNASSVLRYIETMFEDIPLMQSRQLAYPIPPVPVVLVLDLSLITGMDTSAVDVFMDIWRICKTNDCNLYLCGLSPRLKKTFAKGGMRPDTKGPRKSRTLLYFSDIDHGLGRAEDVLIDKNMGDFAKQSLFQLKKGRSGFHVALQLIDQLHSTNMADGLLELEPHTSIVTLEEGQILYKKDGGVIREKDHGLFFIESGMIREDDGRSNRTNTRTGGSFRHGSILAKGNDNTLRMKHARLDTAAYRAALTKLAGREATHHSNNLRISTAGPGW